MNDQSKQHLIEKLINKIENWELFHVNFPDEQSQDAILVHYELENEVYEELMDSVNKFHSGSSKAVLNPPPRVLGLYKNEKNLP